MTKGNTYEQLIYIHKTADVTRDTKENKLNKKKMAKMNAIVEQ
jgi:hypothetical protein